MRLQLALHKELHQSTPKIDVYDSASAKGYQQFLVREARGFLVFLLAWI